MAKYEKDGIVYDLSDPIMIRAFEKVGYILQGAEDPADTVIEDETGIKNEDE